jgi:hypothetical protein
MKMYGEEVRLQEWSASLPPAAALLPMHIEHEAGLEVEYRCAEGLTPADMKTRFLLALSHLNN